MAEKTEKKVHIKKPTVLTEEPTPVSVEKLAQVKVANQDNGKVFAAEKFYLVSSKSPNGFWRIKRKFLREPTEIKASDLTEDEIKSLLEEPFLTVEIVNK